MPRFTSKIAAPYKAPGFVLGSLSLLFMTACSLEAGGDATRLSSEGATEASKDPPGAALPLSIGRRIALEDGDAFSGAIQCAAALGLTAQALTGMSESASNAQVAQIRQAETHFFEQALESLTPDPGDRDTVETAVARQRLEKADEIAGQAQLAIACLRSYGESLQRAEITGTAA